MNRNGTDNTDFLFKEAKKIYDRISEITDKHKNDRLTGMIIADIIKLSSLCCVADRHLSGSELFFISLILLFLNPEKSDKVSEFSRELYISSDLKTQYKEKISDYWESISAYMNRSRSDLSEKNDVLASISYMKEYDRLNGTMYADRLGSAFYEFAQCAVKADGTVTKEEEQRLKQISMLIFNKEKPADLKENFTVETKAEEAETIESVMEEISQLIGMENIKNEIKTFINLVKVQNEREKHNLPVTTMSLHAVFYGPPGTGKTTIARFLGRIYRALGLLKKGHLIETDRAGMVAGYVGQTSAKVDELVNKALDGVLFIDEAYTLATDSGNNDFGQEAIDILLKRMEDYRDRIAVIVAGYPDEMREFIESNPGLKSRFRRYFYFNHYTPEELIKIFDIFSKNASFKVSSPARKKLNDLLIVCYENRKKEFGNGRLVRNCFERIIERQANRIVDIAPLTEKVLCTVSKEDVPDDLESLEFEIKK